MTKTNDNKKPTSKQDTRVFYPEDTSHLPKDEDGLIPVLFPDYTPEMKSILHKPISELTSDDFQIMRDYYEKECGIGFGPATKEDEEALDKLVPGDFDMFTKYADSLDDYATGKISEPYVEPIEVIRHRKVPKVDICGYLSNLYPEVDYETFYSELFPEGSFDTANSFTEGMYNGIAIAKELFPKEKTKRFTITDDHELIGEIVESNDFCFMAPVSYAGKHRSNENARFLYAIAIDLDGIETLSNVSALIKQIENREQLKKHYYGLPRPTYLVCSGTGIHIYYFLKSPVPLYRSYFDELSKLRKRLVEQAWTQGASTLKDDIQYESLTQGFRMVGSITKDGITRTRAFRVGPPVTVEELNEYVPEKSRAVDFTYKSELTLAEAKAKFPDWYERRIVKKEPKKYWQCHRGLYDWWKKKIMEGATEGHRYWCLMYLAVFASKCGVDYKELRKDVYDFVPIFNAIGIESFTKSDARSALQAYKDDKSKTYSRKVISEKTNIHIEPNKRNGNSRADHIEYMNMMRRFKINKGTCAKLGRPKESGTKEETIRQWKLEHPEGTKAQCARDTGISKPTVLKWWCD